MIDGLPKVHRVQVDSGIMASGKSEVFVGLGVWGSLEIQHSPTQMLIQREGAGFGFPVEVVLTVNVSGVAVSENLAMLLGLQNGEQLGVELIPL